MGIIIRQSIKGTVINYVGAFIGFLITFFVSLKYLTGGEIGLIGVITDAAMLICAIGQFGTSDSVIKFFPYFRDEKKRHNGFFFYLVMLPLIGFILVSIVVLIFQAPIKSYFSANAQEFVHYFYWIFPLAFFMIYQSVFEIYSTVLLRIVVPKFIREIVIRVLTLGSYLLYAFKYINFEWVIVILVFTYAIAALINLFYVAHISQISLKPNYNYVRKPLLKSIGYFTSYMIIAALGGTIVDKIDGFMISGMEGLDSNGIYKVAFFMVAIIEMPARSLGGVSIPIASEYFKKKDILSIDKLFKKVALNQFLVGSLVFLLIWINIDNIFEIIPNGENYKAGKWVVFFIGLAKLIGSACGFSRSLLSISKHYYYTLFFTFFLCVLTIIGNYFLIPLFGISGAAVATLSTLIIYNACLLFLVKKKIEIQPFSLGFLKIIVPLLTLLLVNYFWINFANPYLDGIVRSILFGGTFFVVVYSLKVSSDMNNTIKAVANKALQLLQRK